MSELEERLDRAVKKRDQLKEIVQRAKGRLDSARESVTKIEADVRECGIEPDQLGATITALEGRLETAVKELEQQLQEADTALAPYTGED